MLRGRGRLRPQRRGVHGSAVGVPRGAAAQAAARAGQARGPLDAAEHRDTAQRRLAHGLRAVHPHLTDKHRPAY